MSLSPVISQTERIVRYAISICEDYREGGEVNQTKLCEAVMDHFEISDDEFEGEDISFLIYLELDRLNLS